jgi:RNA polymerase sigma-70 factor (ECF subfamily)
VRVVSAIQTLGLGEAEERPSEPGLTVESGFAERLGQGDLEAMAEAYDEHHGALCSFAKRLLGDDHAAEDLVHDVFLVLPELLHRLVPGASLRSFLLGIAANRARHHVRSRARRRRLAERLAHEPQDSAPSPDAASEQRLLAALLASALDTLPLDQRTTFVLKEIEGYSAKEVGDILQIPEATVRTRLFHARRRLRDELEGSDR